MIVNVSESKEALELSKGRTAWPTITQQMRDLSEPESSAAEEDRKRKRGLWTNRNLNVSYFLHSLIYMLWLFY